MIKFISICVVSLSISSTALATADFDPVSECVWDKYFTKADALRIKVEKTKSKEAAAELNKLREKKRAFDTLKKEKFFDAEEGLKTTFPDEYEECSAE